MVTWPSGVSIRASPNFDVLGIMFGSKLTSEDVYNVIVSRVSRRIGILWLVKRVFVNTIFSVTSLLL